MELQVIIIVTSHYLQLTIALCVYMHWSMLYVKPPLIWLKKVILSNINILQLNKIYKHCWFQEVPSSVERPSTSSFINVHTGYSVSTVYWSVYLLYNNIWVWYSYSSHHHHRLPGSFYFSTCHLYASFKSLFSWLFFSYLSNSLSLNSIHSTLSFYKTAFM